MLKLRQSAVLLLILSAQTVAATSRAYPNDSSVGPLLTQLNAVGPQNSGQREASLAWRKLAAADANELPSVLAGLDDAGPLAANWIAQAVDAIAERRRIAARRCLAKRWSGFCSTRITRLGARRLAYEILLRGDPALADRVLPKMLDDPSLEMRRDAVAQVIAEADRLAAAEPIDKAKTVAAYRTALGSARDLDQVNHVAAQLRHFGEKVDLARHFGFITEWQVIGPFDNHDNKGYAAVYPPGARRRSRSFFRWERRQGEMAAACHDRRFRASRFKPSGRQRARRGSLRGSPSLKASQARPVELRLATEDACKLWLNGKLLLESEVYHSFTAMDQFICRGELKAGRNLILVKICQNEQTEDWRRSGNFSSAFAMRSARRFCRRPRRKRREAGDDPIPQSNSS